ncbi:hydrogenase maturation protease [Dechloromonas sp. XY25]|uniref:Hydrogenase maturation protease n=1 Tax=Dechloromonas hankyongensis TaxID=2908002 RepID=A0ABS9K5E3_9RHOO|nr:hydrogenase maturation protease [Dechloromonas hankyongensis]MCG2578389.1 hydrogenase maturation protease [Dechloromonas hankyongensis]
MTAPVVVFAIGNPSRGDDAIGPELLGRLQKWLEKEQLAERVELIEDFQLNIEHALDLEGRELALFIDAGQNTPAPYVFERIFPAAIPSHSTHALPPPAVLQVYRQTESREPPPAFVLCVRGEHFELGEGLTVEALGRVDVAMTLLASLMKQELTLAGWSAAARQ